MKIDETMEIPKVKKVLRTIRFSIMFVIVTSFCLFIFVNIDNINIDNFRRILAKIDFGINSTGAEGDGYVYFSGVDNVFAPFKGGLGVYNTDGLKVFDEKGNQFSGLTAASSAPAVSASDKYIMIYDRGGTALNIANSFALVFSKTFDNKIYCASMSESGGFTVVTEAEGYKALVTVFDSSFHEKFKFYSAEKYIVDAALSNDGKIVAVAYVYPDNSDIKSGVDFYKIGNKEPFSQISLAQGTVFDIQYKESGALTALTDKCAYTINKSAKTAAEFSFEGQKLMAFSHSLKNTALVLAEGVSKSNSQVVVLNDKGKAVTNIAYDSMVQNIGICDSGVALFTGDRLVFADISSGKKLKIKKTVIVTESFENMVASKNNVFLIAGEYAKIESLG